MNEIAIKITGLVKEINNNKILNSIDLQIEKGKIYGLIGRNGSGKTVLLKCICGLMNPTSGEIIVFNKNIKDGNFPDDFGAIIETPGFIPNFSAFDNLKYLASIRNKISDKDIIEAIQSVGLDAENNKSVKKYSLGMKQRLGIAQAIMEGPRLLLLDEPMNGLDSDGMSLVRDLLIRLKNQGVTIIIASHNSDDINILCDEVLKIDNGILH